MSEFLSMWIVGVDGVVWHILGDDEGAEGVELRTKPQKFIDAPAKTFWVDTGYRQQYQGKKFGRRDPVFAVNVFSDSGDPEEWRQIDSDFRMSLGMYDKEFTLYAETSDGIRSLNMRLLQEPVAYEQGDWEGNDPHISAVSTLGIFAAAAQPFWAAQTLVDKCTFTGTSGTKFVTVSNPGDVDIFLRWRVPASCQVTLPDWSWGSSAFGRATEDASRVWAAPQLYAGENTIFDSMPDMPIAIASNKAPVRYRCNGALIYPVAPHTPPTQIPVTLVSGPANSTVYVENDQWFSRLWGVSR